MTFNIDIVWFGVLTVVAINATAFWDVTRHNLVLLLCR
jgi:hypothetical protein